MKTEADLEIHRLAEREKFSPNEQILPGERSANNSAENPLNQKLKKSPYFVSFRVSTRKNLRGTDVAKGEPQ
jgi:hypothetical protein